MSVKKQKSQKESSRNSGIANSITSVKSLVERLDGRLEMQRKCSLTSNAAYNHPKWNRERKIKNPRDCWASGLTAAHRYQVSEPVSATRPWAHSISLCGLGFPTGVSSLSWPLPNQVDSWREKLASWRESRWWGQVSRLREDSKQKWVSKATGVSALLGSVRGEMCKLGAEDTELEEQPRTRCGSLKWERRWTNGFQIEYVIRHFIRGTRSSILTSA